MARLCLVTGAAGFLGRSLVRALVARGDRVRAFDLHPPGGGGGTGVGAPAVGGGTAVGTPAAKVEWVTGDVRDAEAVRRACEGVELVYHLAALIPQRKAGPETMRAVNVGGTANVLEAARAAGARRVVYLSSVEVYGVPKVVPCPEDAPRSPLGEYARNKIAAEDLCRQAGERGLEVVVLRPPTIVGPGLDEPFLLGILQAIRLGKPVTLLGRGQNRFQFVHAEDVAAACLLAGDKPEAAGQDYNLGSADPPSVGEMVAEVIARVGSSSTVRSVPVPLARMMMKLLMPFGLSPLQPEHLAIATADYVFSIEKARTTLGWEPRWGNVEAMLDTYRALA